MFHWPIASPKRASGMNPEEQLVEDIGRFCKDPLGFSLYAWPWGEDGELEEAYGPRIWQRDIFEDIGDHLTGPNRFQPLQIAVASGHGIGKSALIAMIINWGMSTCEDCRIVVTANTEAQLRTKTWPEICKWTKLAINSHWWNITATTISVKETGHERLWRTDAIPWSENNTEAFAGLHNKGKRIIVILDEGSAIPKVIWEVIEGALTDEDTEILFIVFGNPTQNSGSFRECFGRFKHRWITKQIDSRTVDGTNKAQIAKWIADFGVDSDFVRVRVRGEFPRAGSTQFISGEVVAQARRRVLKPEHYIHQWKVLSVDVARFGDDMTTIGVRQGPRYRVHAKLRGLDTMQVAMRARELIERESPRVVVIDGDGLGAGVVDWLRLHMADWFREHQPAKLIEFHGAASPKDGDMYLNQRAEAWGLMRAWLVDADIDDDPELESDLTGPEYFFSSKNQIQLERKEDMKKRGLSSPDIGDNLAMSFVATPTGKTHDERLLEQIEACPDPMEQHFMRLRETERRQRANQPKQYWE